MDINFTSILGKNLKDSNYSASPKKGKKVTDVPESPKSWCTNGQMYLFLVANKNMTAYHKMLKL